MGQLILMSAVYYVKSGSKMRDIAQRSRYGMLTACCQYKYWLWIRYISQILALHSFYCPEWVVPGVHEQHCWHNHHQTNRVINDVFPDNDNKLTLFSGIVLTLVLLYPRIRQARYDDWGYWKSDLDRERTNSTTTRRHLPQCIYKVVTIFYWSI